MAAFQPGAGIAMGYDDLKVVEARNFLSSIAGNGFFVALAALSVEITLFLPLAVAVLSGDAIAGEANQGTLRYLLTVPVRRGRLLAVKYASLVIGAAVVIATIILAGLAAGGALFGLGPVTMLSLQVVRRGEHDDAFSGEPAIQDVGR